MQEFRSGLCGAFFLLFILFVRNINDFDNFIKHFDWVNLYFNDKIAKRLFKDLLFQV